MNILLEDLTGFKCGDVFIMLMQEISFPQKSGGREKVVFLDVKKILWLYIYIYIYIYIIFC